MFGLRIQINGSMNPSGGRARLFFGQICREFGKTKLATLQKNPERVDYEDPMDTLTLAREKDWETYARRKRELAEKGRRWFRKLVKTYWSRKSWLQEFKFKDIEVRWADGRRAKVGRTRIEFSEPRFHGLEFDRVGWVFSTLVKVGKEKFVHTSDLEGVQLEDYQEALIKENPDFLVVDGPATYLFGFMINRINLNRYIENLCKLIREIDGEVIILDHHLLRERRYKERLKKVWLTAKVENKKVLTAADFLGKKPVVLSLN